MEFLWVTRKTL